MLTDSSGGSKRERYAVSASGWEAICRKPGSHPALRRASRSQAERRGWQAVEQHQRELEMESLRPTTLLSTRAQALRPPSSVTPTSTGYERQGRAEGHDSTDLRGFGERLPTLHSTPKAPLVSHLDEDWRKCVKRVASRQVIPPRKSRRQGRARRRTRNKLGERVDWHSDDFDEIDPAGRRAEE